ncbi:MAG: gamma-glutamyltransferase family protein [candidate division KSB1 bacterium]|nr:gamma-glutamyltransferase family protein [candidate division KSB1 bacterium]MDZ7367812.1 gamma-glutamyltransferase family protein [candidate division KSB1 bacterium]MDZ7404860.1 gamma-glutamyltransferase family protein [candidate division KSB1 bacterium]
MWWVMALLAMNNMTYAQTEKPVLHGRHWMAITGKPLAATAGAKIFEAGGNAIDATCAMLAATCTMWDVLSWGGETQALIYNPKTKNVIGVNALGVAPTGATPEFFKKKKMRYPPEHGPLAAVTPGTPGGLMTMLAEFGTMSLKQVLAPAMQMAEGYPIEAQTANSIEREKEKIKQWPYSKKVFLPHLGEKREAPQPGEIFRQPDLLGTLQKLVDAEQQALAAGKSRKEAIDAAYERFYKGDIAQEFVRGSREQGGLITMEDLANWKVYLEAPVMTTYKGIEVYKLNCWVQGPVMLQALNILENFDLKAMGYNSARYIHALYQTMNLVFADRDFYYGDPYFPPEEPIKGLLSKAYAQERLKQIDWEKNDPEVKPGDPYPFEGRKNPYLHFLQKWSNVDTTKTSRLNNESFFAGTTSIQAADKEGWVVSVTPSGGWIPACIAGNTGIGMSQRMQSFVLNESENPFNVVAPGKRPRATLTPTIAMKDGKPFLAFSVQGGDTQDQNLLQFFLNVVEFGMNVQQACEAPNITSFQMRDSFGMHETFPGRLTLNEQMPPWVRSELAKMGYKLSYNKKTSGPITAIYFDWQHGTFWGGASNYGEDYGIAW